QHRARRTSDPARVREPDLPVLVDARRQARAREEAVVVVDEDLARRDLEARIRPLAPESDLHAEQPELALERQVQGVERLRVVEAQLRFDGIRAGRVAREAEEPIAVGVPGLEPVPDLEAPVLRPWPHVIRLQVDLGLALLLVLERQVGGKREWIRGVEGAELFTRLLRIASLVEVELDLELVTPRLPLVRETGLEAPGRASGVLSRKALVDRRRGPRFVHLSRRGQPLGSVVTGIHAAPDPQTEPLRRLEAHLQVEGRGAAGPIGPGILLEEGGRVGDEILAKIVARRLTIRAVQAQAPVQRPRTALQGAARARSELTPRAAVQ